MRAPDASDIAIILGLILLGCGLWMFEPWISLTVTGAALFAYGVTSDVLAGVLRQPERKRKRTP